MLMRIILIDHDDSFTHILAQYLGEISGELPWVVNHKDISIEEIEEYGPSHIVLSPGPGTVEHHKDFMIGEGVLKTFAGRIPILGVCLGHQGIGRFYGATVKHAPTVMHGKRSKISHNGKGLFANITSPMTVMRYHSLIIEDLPDELKVTAETEDGVVMALRHKELPVFGVQFHPESIGTEGGKQLLRNFLFWKS